MKFFKIMEQFCLAQSIMLKDDYNRKNSFLDKDLVKRNTHLMDRNGAKQHFESCLNQYMNATRLNEFIDKELPVTMTSRLSLSLFVDYRMKFELSS